MEMQISHGILHFISDKYGLQITSQHWNIESILELLDY